MAYCSLSVSTPALLCYSNCALAELLDCIREALEHKYIASRPPSERLLPLLSSTCLERVNNLKKQAQSSLCIQDVNECDLVIGCNKKKG